MDAVVYLGTPGRMIPFRCPSSQSLAMDDGVTFEQSLEGAVSAQIRKIRVRRQWDLGIGAGTPKDIANALAFVAGEYGIGPFVWVSADAPVTNLLSPDVSTCGVTADVGATISVAGAMTLPDGVAGRSLSNSNAAQNMFFGSAVTPVIQGVKVTASAYLAGAGCRVGLAFYDATGAYITAVVSPAGSATASRLSVTAIPPAGAVLCAVYGASALNGARPAITWTDSVFDWAPGEGCPKAILHGASRDLFLALREPNYGRHSNLSATITELG